jgi:tripartite-type tricarboxylate transporter receptor subunit TctC
MGYYPKQTSVRCPAQSQSIFRLLFGIVAPTGTPERTIEQLNRSINDALRHSDVRDGLARLGIEPNSGSIQNFSDFIAEATPRWKEIVRVTGIRVGG